MVLGSTPDENPNQTATLSTNLRECAVCKFCFDSEDKTPRIYCLQRGSPGIRLPRIQNLQFSVTPMQTTKSPSSKERVSTSSLKTLLAAYDRARPIKPSHESEDSLNLSGTFGFSVSDRRKGGHVVDTSVDESTTSSPSSTSSSSAYMKSTRRASGDSRPKRYVTVPLELLNDDHAVDLLRDSLKVHKSLAGKTRTRQRRSKRPGHRHEHKLVTEKIICDSERDGLEHIIVKTREDMDAADILRHVEWKSSLSSPKLENWAKISGKQPLIQERMLEHKPSDILALMTTPANEFSALAKREIRNNVDLFPSTKKRHKSMNIQSEKGHRKARTKSSPSKQQIDYHDIWLLHEIKKILKDFLMKSSITSNQKYLSRDTSPAIPIATENFTSHVYDSEGAPVAEDPKMAAIITRPFEHSPTKMSPEVSRSSKVSSPHLTSRKSPESLQQSGAERVFGSNSSKAHSPIINNKSSEKPSPENSSQKFASAHASSNKPNSPIVNNEPKEISNELSSQCPADLISKESKPEPDPEATSQLVEPVEKTFPSDQQSHVREITEKSKSADDVNENVRHSRLCRGFHSTLSSGNESKILTTAFRLNQASAGAASGMCFSSDNIVALGGADQQKGSTTDDFETALSSGRSSAKASISRGNWSEILETVPKSPQDLDMVPSVMSMTDGKTKSWITDVRLKPGDNVLLRGIFDGASEISESPTNPASYFTIDFWKIPVKTSPNSSKSLQRADRTFFLESVFSERKLWVGSNVDPGWRREVASGDDFAFEKGTAFKFVFYFKTDNFILKWTGVNGKGELICSYLSPVEETTHLRVTNCKELESALIFY